MSGRIVVACIGLPQHGAGDYAPREALCREKIADRVAIELMLTFEVHGLPDGELQAINRSEEGREAQEQAVNDASDAVINTPGFAGWSRADRVKAGAKATRDAANDYEASDETGYAEDRRYIHQQGHLEINSEDMKGKIHTERVKLDEIFQLSVGAAVIPGDLPGNDVAKIKGGDAHAGWYPYPGRCAIRLSAEFMLWYCTVGADGKAGSSGRCVLPGFQAMEYGESNYEGRGPNDEKPGTLIGRKDRTAEMFGPAGQPYPTPKPAASVPGRPYTYKTMWVDHCPFRADVLWEKGRRTDRADPLFGWPSAKSWVGRDVGLETTGGIRVLDD